MRFCTAAVCLAEAVSSLHRNDVELEASTSCHDLQLASGTSSNAADAHASSILHHSSKIAYLVLSKQPDESGITEYYQTWLRHWRLDDPII